MEQGIKGEAYESYQELVNSQEKVSNQDFEVMIVDNIFDEADIAYIYSIVNSTPEDKTKLQKWAGHRAWHVKLPEIEGKINKAIEKTSLAGKVRLVGDYSFARYDPAYGYECKLFPHCDLRDEQRITFDIQIHADQQWGLVVEDKSYFIEDNQALVFAGTQQTHWREKTKILPGNKIDMVFCHLEYIEPTPLDEGQDAILAERTRFLSEFYNLESNEELYKD